MEAIRPHVHDLTPMQTEVLRLLACGFCYQDIGRIRGGSWRTAQRHAYDIYDKLDVSNQTEAACIAWRTGIISVDEAWQTLMRHRAARTVEGDK